MSDALFHGATAEIAVPAAVAFAYLADRSIQAEQSPLVGCDGSGAAWYRRGTKVFKSESE